MSSEVRFTLGADARAGEVLVGDPATGLLQPTGAFPKRQVALFVQVSGRWRYEGMIEVSLYNRSADVLRDVSERENGPGTFWSVVLP